MMIKGSFMWNLKPSGKVKNHEVISHNGIHYVMNDGLKIDCLEWHHIIS